MLVCDTCDKGYHTFCLVPIMTTIPKNGWKCKVCIDFCIFNNILSVVFIYLKHFRLLVGEYYKFQPKH